MIPIQRLVEELENLPALIGRKGYEIEQAREVYQMLELECDRLEAVKALENKVQEPKITAVMLKWKINNDDDVFEKRMAVIKAETILKKKMVEITHFDNKFTSYKKIVEIKKIEAKY